MKKSCLEYVAVHLHLWHLTSDFGFGAKDTKPVYGFWNHFQNGVYILFYNLIMDVDLIPTFSVPYNQYNQHWYHLITCLYQSY